MAGLSFLIGTSILYLTNFVKKSKVFLVHVREISYGYVPIEAKNKREAMKKYNADLESGMIDPKLHDSEYETIGILEDK